MYIPLALNYETGQLLIGRVTPNLAFAEENAAADYKGLKYRIFTIDEDMIVEFESWLGECGILEIFHADLTLKLLNTLLIRC